MREIGAAFANLISVGRSAIVVVLNVIVVLLPIVLVGAVVGGLVGRAAAPIGRIIGGLLGVSAKRRTSRRR